MSRTIAVAFCTDQFMETPLHVAMSSLLRNLAADCSVRFYLILTGFTEKKLQRLRKTLDATGRAYSLHLLEAPDHALFERFPALHGSKTIYHRLLLPELVDEPRLLYLDSDIRVHMDLAPLFTCEMGTAPAGFVVDGTVRNSLDAEFQLSAGKKLEDPSFNSGVVLFNLPEWRRQGCTEAVFAFGNRCGSAMVNRDQSLLNALFANTCCQLDRQFNCTVQAFTDPATVPKDAVIHYIGSPKPWDIGGRFVHASAAPWYRALRQTALPCLIRSPWFDRYGWQRLPKIVGGYRLALQIRLRKLFGI